MTFSLLNLKYDNYFMPSLNILYSFRIDKPGRMEILSFCLIQHNLWALILNIERIKYKITRKFLFLSHYIILLNLIVKRVLKIFILFLEKNIIYISLIFLFTFDFLGGFEGKKSRLRKLKNLRIRHPKSLTNRFN